MSFVRGNNLVISGRFWSANNVQPTTAVCTLRYYDLADAVQTVTVALSFDPGTNYWTGSWDSSVAGPGRVQWVVQGDGALAAAAEGSFIIVANAANGAPSEKFAPWSEYGG